MNTYYINAARGLVLGVITRRGNGYSFMPFTSAHRSSRKAHVTMESSVRHYSIPSGRFIEAINVPDACKIAKEAEQRFDANEPCKSCIHQPRQAGVTTCAGGAAPMLARNIGRCGKLQVTA